MTGSDARDAAEATATDNPRELWEAVAARRCSMPRFFERTPAGYVAIFFDGTMLHRYDGNCFASTPDLPTSAQLDRASQSTLNRLVEAGVAEPMSSEDAPAFPESRLDALVDFLREVDIVSPLVSGESMASVVGRAGYSDVVDLSALRARELDALRPIEVPLLDGRVVTITGEDDFVDVHFPA